MKKFLISFCSLFSAFLITIVAILGYSHSLQQQYDKTYLAAMSDKYDRLKSIDDKKIVLVGGSNLPFGIDSEILEKELGYKVVNFGLYAALGSKTTLDLSKNNINKNDIIIFVPEFSPQTYSKYVNGEIMLQTLDSNKKMVFDIPITDWFIMANNYPSYMKAKKEYAISGEKPSPEGVYSRSAFNSYGDIEIERPYNVMPDMFDTENLIDIDKEYISEDFVEYFNKYTKWAKRRKAQVFISFPPVNMSGLSKDSTFEKRLEFYNAVREKFDAPVISNIENYLFSEDYFYDSNYHLNDSGVLNRTIRLIGDIKRGLGITTSTDIPIPDGSGSAGSSGGENNDEDNDLSLDFVYEVTNGKVIITGVSDVGLTKSKLIIPATVDGNFVYKINQNVFALATNLTELTIPKTVQIMENGIFSGASKLITVRLDLDLSSQAKLPTVGTELFVGANENLKIYVPKAKYMAITTDYFWMGHSSRIAKLEDLE